MKKYVVAIIGAVVLFGFIIGFKLHLINKYDLNKIDRYESTIAKFDTSNKLTLNKKTVSNYKNLNNFYIKNDFQDYKINNLEIPNNISLQFMNKNEKKGIIMSIYDSYYLLLKNNYDTYTDSTNEIEKINLEEYYKKHNINNDIDLMNYAHNLKTGFFTPITEVKENYSFISTLSILYMDIDNMKLIDGDYNGYMVKYKNDVTQYNIIDNNKTYSLRFVGSSLYSEKYMNELASTIDIKK